jgi:hypothetical protein
MNRVVPKLCAFWFLAVGLGSGPPTSCGEGGEDRVVKEFSERMDKYVDLRKKLEAESPKLPEKAEPEQIQAHEKQLAARIKTARAAARQGDLFFPAVAERIKSIVRAEMTGPANEPARKEIKDGNPKIEGGPTSVRVAANADYPDGQPVSTMPPTLLLKLPAAPKGLEFRFVGRDLVLMDAKANLILDYIKDAAPPLRN